MEQQYLEMEHRYQQRVRELEAENRNLQTLTEDLLTSNSAGKVGDDNSEGEAGHHGGAHRGFEDDGALAAAEAEAERLREHAEELEKELAETSGFRERVRELEEELQQVREASQQQQGHSREVIALQAERRAWFEEKAALQRALEDAEAQRNEQGQHGLREADGDMASLPTAPAASDEGGAARGPSIAVLEEEIAALRVDKERLERRCEGLAELAEQACTRAEQVRNKFEQAEAIRATSLPGGLQAPGEPVISGGKADALSGTTLAFAEGPPVPLSAPVRHIAEGPSVLPAPTIAHGTPPFGGDAGAKGRPLASSRVSQAHVASATRLSAPAAPIRHVPAAPPSAVPAAGGPLSGGVPPAIVLLSPPSSAASLAPVGRPLSPRLPSTPPAPRPVPGSGFDYLMASESGRAPSYH
uniref:Uncharacterized protein n=1 Tax=Zooxanthella nutricula TaxID=1333877 RepID=A0A7S2P410_9DINO